MEKYFEDENLYEENTNALKATISGKVVPMMCGSAFKNKGVQTMLDMVGNLPSLDEAFGTNPILKRRK